MDWDSDLTEQDAAQQSNGGFDFLPPGEYTAEVKKMEKDSYTATPTSKIPSCPKAVVHLLVTAPDGRRNYFRENLFLYDGNKWQLLQFFTSLGLRRHGDGKTAMPWNRVAGCTCRVRLGQRQYNGKTYNQVTRWLDPAPAAERASAAPAAQQAPEDLPEW